MKFMGCVHFVEKSEIRAFRLLQLLIFIINIFDNTVTHLLCRLQLAVNTFY